MWDKMTVRSWFLGKKKLLGNYDFHTTTNCFDRMVRITLGISHSTIRQGKNVFRFFNTKLLWTCIVCQSFNVG